jgi:hypothetical protein
MTSAKVRRVGQRQAPKWHDRLTGTLVVKSMDYQIHLRIVNCDCINIQLSRYLRS